MEEKDSLCQQQSGEQIAVEEPPLICSQKSLDFKNKYFKEATIEDWNDWKWQIRNSIKSYDDLRKYEVDFDDEVENLQLPLRITPYYLSVCKDSNLLKTMIPSINETIISDDESLDPLCEEEARKTNCIVHRYPDRVLFLVSNSCSNNCRFCTRSRIIDNNKNVVNKSDYQDAFDYIREHKISDIILSGGDSLLLSDNTIEYLLKELRSIPTVEIIRIGTKVLSVMPMRITKELCNILSKYHPLYMSVHFTRHDELTEETKQACELLSNHGIVLRSQTVLLKDVNNTHDELKQLFKGLLKFRVSPYYIYTCDKTHGSHHFRVPEKESIELLKSLRNNISGYAIPTLIRDSKYGKIPLNHEYL